MFQPQTHNERRGGIRTRFFPRSRIAQGLISVAPWVDIVLLVVLFLVVGSRIILQPGVVVSLPEAPFTDGARPGMTVVVLSVGSEHAGTREEMVFFDDERFRAGDSAQMERLRQAIARAARARPDANLILQADQRIRHGTIVALMNMALEVGVARVIIAEKPRNQ